MMKLLQISYHNYRCFQDDMTLKFNTTGDKNIALVIAPNGGGKTEMLFSFWYVLYDFDFSSLKEKKATPYALNAQSYLKLKNGENNDTDNCYVTLSFENDGKIYTISRKEIYTKKSSGIVSEQLVTLITRDRNNSKSLPLSDKDAIYRIIERIIPKKILHGIIFDGERMKELSKVGVESRDAIQGIIQDITNEELYEMCKTELEEIKKKAKKDQTKYASSMPSCSLNELISNISSLEEKNKILTTEIEINKGIIESNTNRIREIEVELRNDESSRENEIKREGYKKQLDSANKRLENEVDNFYHALDNGYLLLCDKLFNDIESRIKSEDIPDDLTVKAVESILHGKSGKCICGHDIHECEREILLDLIKKLPPDNINSTILQMCKGSKHAEADAERNLKLFFKNIRETEKEIEELKAQITEVSARIIGEGVSARVKELEKERADLTYVKRRAAEDNISKDVAIKNNKKDIAEYSKQRDNLSKNSKDLNFYVTKERIAEHFLEALVSLDEANSKKALLNINEKLDKAYMNISEDYTRGRRIYIVQFDEKSKYRLISYYQSQYDERFQSALKSGLLETFKIKGLSSEEIHEKIILEVATSNSTGQSKINTLAFAKAILDYSNEERDENSFEITKNYPFMIDSPFTELSGDNLFFSSRALHTFARQIILMVSAKSLETVEQNIKPFVGSINKLRKIEGESRSVLE